MIVIFPVFGAIVNTAIVFDIVYFHDFVTFHGFCIWISFSVGEYYLVKTAYI